MGRRRLYRSPLPRSQSRMEHPLHMRGSQARDPVKGVKAKYQLAVTKEPLLSVIVEMDAYKATRAKIEAYGEQCGRFWGAE